VVLLTTDEPVESVTTAAPVRRSNVAHQTKRAPSPPTLRVAPYVTTSGAGAAARASF
jgi:hypothetical protein